MRAAIAILLAVFLPLAALMVVLFEPVCYAVANATVGQGIADAAEQEYLVEVAMAVRAFSLGNNSAAMPLGDDYQTAITPDAIMHLLDVRVVFIACEIACALVLIALLVLVVITVRKKGAGYLGRSLIIGGAIPLAAAALLALAIGVDFNAFFTWMHGIFFAEGTWTFPADSLLIRSLPFSFWIGCAAVWAGSMALLCIISLCVGVVLKRRGRHLR